MKKDICSGNQYDIREGNLEAELLRRGDVLIRGDNEPKELVIWVGDSEKFKTPHLLACRYFEGKLQFISYDILDGIVDILNPNIEDVPRKPETRIATKSRLYYLGALADRGLIK